MPGGPGGPFLLLLGPATPVSRSLTSWQEANAGVTLEVSHPFNITDQVDLEVAHPWNASEQVTLEVAHLFSRPGPIALSVLHPFSIQMPGGSTGDPLVPRNWTQTVTQRSSSIAVYRQGSPFANLKIKSWRYQANTQTTGFAVDQVQVVYTEVSPSTFEAIVATMAAPRSDDTVDIYVTVAGQQTLLFEGIVRQWYLKEGPDGVMEAHLVAEDRRARMLDTMVPQGLFARGMLEDPATGTRSFQITFLTAVQLLASLAAITIDTSNCPDYPVAPHLTFSGRTTVASAIGRLMRVYQLIGQRKVDLIRTGTDSYRMQQRPYPLPSGTPLPTSGTRLRKYTKSYIPRIQRAQMFGYSGASRRPRTSSRCAVDMATGRATNCNRPETIIDLTKSTVCTPFVAHDTQNRVTEEGQVCQTTFFGKVIKVVKTSKAYAYSASQPGVFATTNIVEETDTTYDWTGQPTKVLATIYQDGQLVKRSTKETTYDTSYQVFGSPAKVLVETQTEEGLVSIDPYTRAALKPPQFATISQQTHVKVPSGGLTFKSWSRFTPGQTQDGLPNLIPDTSVHELSPGNMTPASAPTQKVLPDLTGSATTDVVMEGGTWSGGDGMLADDGVAAQIAGWALEAGNSFHCEVELELPIDPSILVGSIVSPPDTLGVAVTDVFVLAVEVQDSDVGTMTVKADVYLPGAADDLGGTLFPSGGAEHTFSLYDVKTGQTEQVTFLHGIIESMNADGTYEVYCQEEQTVWPSVPIRGASTDYPLFRGDQIIVERIGMVLYGII